MKSKELIEVLRQAPEAEVGYNGHLKITNARVDSNDYVELDGQTARSDCEERANGVFVVSTEYENGKFEVNAVFSARERAEKLKEDIEKHSEETDNGYGNIKAVKINNMFVLK